MTKYKPQKESKRHATKHREKDLDQIWDELHSEKPKIKKNKKKMDPSLPGLGKFYCKYCARYFINQNAQEAHEKESLHKRRVKKLTKEKPYGDLESQMIRVDNGTPIRRTRNNNNMEQ